MDVEKKVLRAVKEYNLILPNDNVLIAFSGGPDSVALTYILLKLKNYLGINKIGLAHFNHLLRKESFKDEEFSINFGKDHNIPVFTKKADIGKIAKELKKSIEDVGRQERYKFLEEVSKKESFNKIATAHHLSDLAETMTLWFIQGNKRGLRGFRPKSDKVIRPLFYVSKEEILKYCKDNDLDYITDVSNFSERYLRNRVRIKVIPVMKDINKSLENSLERMSYFLDVDENYFDSKVKEILKEIKTEYIPYNFLKTLNKALQYRVIQKFCEKKGLIISYQKLKNILEFIENPKKNGYIKLSSEYVLVYDGENILIKSVNDMEKVGFLYKLKVGEKVYIKEAGMWIESFKTNKVDVMKLKECNDVVCFDLEAEEFIVRNRREGDRMIPFGHKTEKKVKDILIDMKLPKTIRNNIPILAFGDKILWVCGYRRSALFPVREESKNVICFRLIKEV
ncbi:MAG: tRNA lysidine(34) synthetase TilS [Hydrogenothermaceae bacterium]|nr:tRNA lysidine(34) synthetase TilS [Hydrogenothermaceae bacterium]